MRSTRSSTSPIVVAGLALAAAACGGETGSGSRVKLSELAPPVAREEGRFHGTCPAGRFAVAFRAGRDITIRNEDGRVASLSAEEAFIGCPGAQVDKNLSGQEWLFKQFTRPLEQPTRLLCETDETIDVEVVPVFEFDTLVGGAIYVSTPPRPSEAGRRALVAASFREDGGSEVRYHVPRCRVDAG